MKNEGWSANRTVGRTVWLLAQVRGYNEKQQLAQALGFSPSLITRKINGSVPWTVDELEKAAEVLGLSNWGDLSRPLAELVGSAEGNDQGRAIAGTSGWKCPPSSRPGSGLAQVLPLRRDFRTDARRAGHGAAPVARLGASLAGGRAYSA